MSKRKRRAVKFTDKKHSVKGIISFAIGLFSCIAFIIISYLSSLSGGKGGIGFGVAGILLFGLTIEGLVLGVKSSKEKEILYLAPVAGLILNGFFVCLYFILYIMGIGL